jgi:hypothetical protein
MIKQYRVYFSLYGKKMQATVEAYNESDARARIRDKVVFHAVREEAQEDAGLKKSPKVKTVVTAKAQESDDELDEIVLSCREQDDENILLDTQATTSVFKNAALRSDEIAGKNGGLYAGPRGLPPSGDPVSMLVHGVC